MATADKVREVCKHKSASEHKKKKSKLISEKVGHIDDDNDDDLSEVGRFQAHKQMPGFCCPTAGDIKKGSNYVCDQSIGVGNDLLNGFVLVDSTQMTEGKSLMLGHGGNPNQ
ncbi:hypothetical protein RUM44_010258 [Polyplax serrata]|uniref:Uncharacterized protein n=1 Tax=Polyplax serrata TaxID=468196 RepID=A0ABR1AV10_POLSC